LRHTAERVTRAFPLLAVVAVAGALAWPGPLARLAPAIPWLLGAVMLGMGATLTGAAFRRAIDLRPSGEAYNNAGTNFYYGGDFETALDLFERAAELAPADYRYHGAVGDACRRVAECRGEATRHYRQALKLANEQLQVNPRNPSASALKGLYLAHLGEADAAREAIERALAIDDDNIDVLWSAAVVRTLQGDRASAEQAVRRLAEVGYPRAALEADPDLRPLGVDAVLQRGQAEE